MTLGKYGWFELSEVEKLRAEVKRLGAAKVNPHVPEGYAANLQDELRRAYLDGQRIAQEQRAQGFDAGRAEGYAKARAEDEAAMAEFQRLYDEASAHCRRLAEDLDGLRSERNDRPEALLRAENACVGYRNDIAALQETMRREANEARRAGYHHGYDDGLAASLDKVSGEACAQRVELAKVDGWQSREAEVEALRREVETAREAGYQSGLVDVQTQVSAAFERGKRTAFGDASLTAALEAERAAGYHSGRDVGYSEGHAFASKAVDKALAESFEQGRLRGYAELEPARERAALSDELEAALESAGVTLAERDAEVRDARALAESFRAEVTELRPRCFNLSEDLAAADVRVKDLELAVARRGVGQSYNEGWEAGREQGIKTARGLEYVPAAEHKAAVAKVLRALETQAEAFGAAVATYRIEADGLKAELAALTGDDLVLRGDMEAAMARCYNEGLAEGSPVARAEGFVEGEESGHYAAVFDAAQYLGAHAVILRTHGCISCAEGLAGVAFELPGVLGSLRDGRIGARRRSGR